MAHRDTHQMKDTVSRREQFARDLVLAAVTVAALAATVPAAEDPQTSARTRWFRETRVGIIVHWGLYSVPAGVWNGVEIPWYGEWIKDRAKISDADYARLAAQFNPVKFNARQWIGLVRQSGFRYFCLVTKHHDGFSLWDTKENSNWNVVDATPFGRDIVREISDACRDSAVTCALYYSSGLDWHYPSTSWTAYKQYYYNQIKELLTNYGRIGYLWFDGEWTGQWNEQEAANILNYVKTLDPAVLTNNPKKKSSSAFGDFGIDEENYSPSDTAFAHGLWERDRLVQFNTWGYKSWEPWKKSDTLIREMIDAASKSMNYCLNIGPMADGTFPPQAVAILNDFGRWLRTNGQSIYGTTGFVRGSTINDSSRITCKDTLTHYAHIINWRASPLIITTSLPVTTVSALDPGISLGTVGIVRTNNVTTITVPRPTSPDPIATVLKLSRTAATAVQGAMPVRATRCRMSSTGSYTLRGKFVREHAGPARKTAGLTILRRESEWQAVAR